MFGYWKKQYEHAAATLREAKQENERLEKEVDTLSRYCVGLEAENRKLTAANDAADEEASNQAKIAQINAEALAERKKRGRKE